MTLAVADRRQLPIANVDEPPMGHTVTVGTAR